MVRSIELWVSLQQAGPEPGRLRWAGPPLGGPSERFEGQQLPTKWTSEAIRQPDTGRQRPGEEGRKSHSDIGRAV